MQELQAEREAERQRLQALEAQREQDQRQMAEMIKFTQQMVQVWTYIMLDLVLCILKTVLFILRIFSMFLVHIRIYVL